MSFSLLFDVEKHRIILCFIFFAAIKLVKKILKAMQRAKARVKREKNVK